MKPIKRIVIVGGGAGGLILATKLAKQYRHSPNHRVILVNECEKHFWKPRIHELVLKSSRTEHVFDYREHAQKHQYEFIYGVFYDLIKATNTIRIKQGEEMFSINYDILVLAVGGQSQTYSIPGVTKYAMTLDSIKKAEQTQKMIFTKLRTLQQDLNIAVIGGGLAGVEFSAECYAVFNEIMQQTTEQRKLKLHITLIESQQRIFPSLSLKLSQHASQYLSDLGINLKTGTSVENIDQRNINTTSGDKINYDIVLWAAGTKPAWDSITAKSVQDRLRDSTINEYCQSSLADNIFMIGDCAKLDDRQIKPKSLGTAQLAQQQAIYLAKQIPKYCAKRNLGKIQYYDLGTLLSCRAKQGFAAMRLPIVGDFKIPILLSRFLYYVIHTMHRGYINGFIDAVYTDYKLLLKEKDHGKC